jgi:protein-S-isoprenylcysteine O-methyltransferase Ste14
MKRWILYTVVSLTRIVADVPLLWMFYLLHFQEQESAGAWAAASNAALFVMFGSLHSLLARNFAREWMARVVGGQFVRIAYVWIAGVTFFCLLFLWQPLPGTIWSTVGVAFWILSVVYAVLVFAIILTTFFIDYAEFLGIRTLLRQARNQPPKPPVFSLRGPYAYCRHPLYLLLLFAFWVGPEMTYGRFEFALLGSAYLFVGANFEERNLREELGEIYERYRRNVPMWIPRLTPWKPE